MVLMLYRCMRVAHPSIKAPFFSTRMLRSKDKLAPFLTCHAVHAMRFSKRICKATGRRGKFRVGGHSCFENLFFLLFLPVMLLQVMKSSTSNDTK